MRRKLIAAGLLIGGLAAGMLLFKALRHMKFSPLSFSRPESPTSILLDDGGRLICRGGIVRSERPIRVRLFAPDALIRIQNAKREHRIRIENIFRGSRITFNGEPITLKTSSPFEATIRDGVVRITAPRKGWFRFVAFGDVECASTSDVERLMKVLTGLRERTGADFAVLLGDIVKGCPKTLEEVADMLAELPFPVYAVVGNHDFSSSTARFFCRHLAPLNYQFTFSDTLFVFFNNADEFPPASFPSAEMDAVLARLKNTSAKTVIFICHKPLEDPRPGKHHHMDRHSAAELLKERLLDGCVDVVLSGHINLWHMKKERNTLFVIAGEGFEEGAEAALVSIAEDGTVIVKPTPLWKKKNER